MTILALYIDQSGIYGPKKESKLSKENWFSKTFESNGILIDLKHYLTNLAGLSRLFLTYYNNFRKKTTAVPGLKGKKKGHFEQNMGIYQQNV